MPDLMLCATQRCGSTMIAEDMRNCGLLGQPEEWFIPWTGELTDAHRSWKPDLDKVRDRATGDNGVCAIKVMANQLNDVEERLKSFLRPPPGPMFFRFFKAFQGATWVWLRREDIVAQAVSRLMARKTGINHATMGEDHFAGNLMRGLDRTYNKGTEYDYDMILSEATAITLETLAWTRFFEAFGITPLVITYEEAAADPDMTHLDRMAAALGLGGEIPRTPRKIVKIGNDRNDDFIRRFHREAAERGFRH